MPNSVNVSVTGAPPVEGTWSPVIDLSEFNSGRNSYGWGNVSIYFDSAVGTIRIQRSLDGGVTWRDIETFTASEETAVNDKGRKVQYRIGSAQGDWASGTITGLITKSIDLP